MLMVNLESFFTYVIKTLFIKNSIFLRDEMGRLNLF